MAYINNLYVFVEDEDVDISVDSTSHAVEKGVPLTDHVQKKPVKLSLKGKIVDTPTLKSHEILAKLKQLEIEGSLIEYAGRNIIRSVQIKSFSTSHPNTNWGGADFSMTLEEVRIAESPYKEPAPTPVEPKEETVAVTLEVGAIVVFKGGPVYVSSDATKAAANRNRSTCKITKISKASYSVHQYHLISTDSGNVYGWVDLSNIETSKTVSANTTSTVGTQQVQQGTNTNVYHTVKSGDTVWNLVNNTYKSLGSSVDYVMKNNQSAFGTKGDAKTLKIGAKLLVGVRK